MSNVLLLRAASQDVPDKYESSFVAAGYVPVPVPVLETSLTNADELARILSCDTSFSGVILTSARACEAWKSASASKADATLEHWSSLPFYVVGKSTASALRGLGDTPTPKDIRGEESGSAEQLARYILNDSGQLSGKLLYLTGDKNRDTLPNILTSGGLVLHQLQVYETRGSLHFATDLANALSNGSDGNDPWWIVYFAPSAAEFVTPSLKLYFNIAGTEEDPLQKRRVARIAVIGATTHQFLRDNLKLHVHVVAPKPTPDELVSAIKAHDNVVAG